MENYTEADKVYVLNKNEILLAVFDKDDEYSIINPQVQKTQNAESVFTFTISPTNPKWAQINNPENLYVVDGKVYSTNFEGCFTEIISDNNENLIQVTAYERQKLLSRKFVRAWNSETGFEIIDNFMVVILSNGDLDLKNDGTVVDSTHEKGTSGYVLDGLLYGTGWTTGICDVQGKFDFETEQLDIYENILKVQQMWGGILVFDSVNKIIHHRDEMTWTPYHGYEVKYQKNMQSLEKLYNNKIITKLCPLGEGGLNIKSVNNDSEWLTDFSYTDTILEGIENNSDIYDADQLKRWGERKLQQLCKPRIELTVKAVLLYQVEGYELEKVDLNDIVDVIDFTNLNSDLDAEIIQLRVVGFTYKIWDYSDAILELSNITQDSTDVFKESVQATNQINDGTLSANQVLDFSRGGQTVEKSLKNLKASIIINENSILNIVEDVESQGNRLSIVSQTLGELNSKIQDIADITVSAESQLGAISLINVNESEPIIIKVHPIDKSITYLYPRSNLYPSSNLYMTDRKIRFKNTSTNEIIDYKLPGNLLYYDENNYDEFLLDYETHTCEIRKKVGYNADGTTYILQNPQVVSYSYPTIELTAGNYEVSLPGYNNAYIYATLMAANYYTTQFVTDITLNSRIRQAVDDINISVNQRLENYSTTTQMNAAIDLKANQINIEVAKKVNYSEFNHAQIALMLNDNSSQIKIKADKIDLSGYVTITNLLNGTTTIDGSCIKTGTIDANLVEVTNINANNIVSGVIRSKNYVTGESGTAINLNSGIIDTPNFKVNASGNVTIIGKITANDGRIGGFTIKETYIYNNKPTLTSQTAGVYIGTDGISLGPNSTFKVTANGELTATSGTIGGCTIIDNVLTIKNANIESINGNKIINNSVSNEKISSVAPDKFSSGTVNTDEFIIETEYGFIKCGLGVNHPYVSSLNVGLGSGGISFRDGRTIDNVGYEIGEIYMDVSGGENVMYLASSGGINLMNGGARIFSNGVKTANLWSDTCLIDLNYNLDLWSGQGYHVRANGTQVGGDNSTLNIKENIKERDTSKVLDILKQIKLYDYNYIPEFYEGKKSYGYIIDYLEKIPELKEYVHFVDINRNPQYPTKVIENQEEWIKFLLACVIELNKLLGKEA